MNEKGQQMIKKERKFGFANRSPYDLSQPELSIRNQISGRKQHAQKESSGPSYSPAAPPSREVLKRIKLR